jgi:hypothetical protein
MVFNSIWTILALMYLIVVPWRFSETIAHHKFAILGVEAVTMIFWFAGFIALAVFLTGRTCYGQVCNSARATAVFGAFEWCVCAISSVFGITDQVKQGAIRCDDRHGRDACVTDQGSNYAR